MRAWDGAPQPPAARIGWRGWLRVLRRGVPMAVVTFGGLAVLAAARLVERPLCGERRPLTPWITVGVCRAALRLMGLRRRQQGRPLRSGGAWVANHVSWLDVLVLNARAPVYFVAKSEVADWPGIGWLARATGTVFVIRHPREAGRQRALLEARLRARHVLCLFPEGTSTDGRRVLPFKTTLFAAFMEAQQGAGRSVQPVTLAYHAPCGARADLYGWWGDRGFADHLIEILAARRHGAVDVAHHDVLPVGTDRKALARDAEARVRAGLAAVGISPPPA